MRKGMSAALLFSVPLLLNATLAAPAQQPSRIAWEFDKEGDARAWKPVRLSPFRASSGMLKAEATGRDPWMVSPLTSIDASAKRYITVRMKVNEKRRGEIFWITSQDRKYDENKTFKFAHEKAGQFVEYLFNLSQVKSWKGEVVQLRFDPFNEGDGSIEIDYIRVLSRSECPPKLEVSRLAMERLLVGVGKAFNASCKVENTGGPAQGGSAELDLPEGMTLVSGRSRVGIPSLQFDQPMQLVWTLRADRPLAGEFGVTVRLKGLQEVTRRTKVVAASPMPVAGKPYARLTAEKVGEDLFLGNSRLRAVFARNAFGYGVSAVDVNSRGKWKRMAVSPSFSWLSVRKGQDTVRTPVFAKNGRMISSGAKKGVEFRDSFQDGAGAKWEVRFAFSLGEKDHWMKVDYEATPHGSGSLVHLQGPTLYVGEGSFGGKKHDAQFCGLEWLDSDETSSSNTTCHKPSEYIRYVPRPTKVTIPLMAVSHDGCAIGLAWDCLQEWDGRLMYPSAVFASPNSLEGRDNHMMGLFLPSIPEYVQENGLEATKPYPFAAGKPLKLQAYVMVLPQAVNTLDCVDKYFEIFGVPDPAPIPRGDYAREVDFSMRAYTETLWVEKEQKWWLQDGCRLAQNKGLPSGYILQLKMASLVTRDRNLREKYEAMAERAAKLAGRAAPTDPYDLPLARLRSLASRAQSLMKQTHYAERHDDGVYRYKGKGIRSSRGWDYSQFGRQGDVAIGICAQPLSTIMKYVRMSGDQQMFKEAEKTLRFMDRFQIPRAGEPGNFALQTVSILAARYALDAYLEAYRYTGNRHYLDKAVYWARAGIPFLYVWNPPSPDEAIMLRYASIPDYGSEYFRGGGGGQGSWWGYPVQWEGLCYAYSLLQLAEHDSTLPWRRIGQGIAISAMYQQVVDGEEDSAGYGRRLSRPDVALLPDFVCPFTWRKYACFAPGSRVLPCVYNLIGRDLEPRTYFATRGEERLHINTRASVSNISWDRDGLKLDLSFPKGEKGYVLIACIGKPDRVRVAGRDTEQVADPTKSQRDAWRHSGNCLEIRVMSTNASIDVGNAKLSRTN